MPTAVFASTSTPVSSWNTCGVASLADSAVGVKIGISGSVTGVPTGTGGTSRDTSWDRAYPLAVSPVAWMYRSRSAWSDRQSA